MAIVRVKPFAHTNNFNIKAKSNFHYGVVPCQSFTIINAKKMNSFRYFGAIVILSVFVNSLVSGESECKSLLEVKSSV